MLFIGKLHPLLVHLPIGFLLIGVILHWWETFDRRKQFSMVITPIFLLGSFAATLSSITGLLLANGGEYDLTIIERHRNSGIVLTLLSFLLWIVHKKAASQKMKDFFASAVLILIFITGHFGGTLTHGSGYLGFSDSKETNSNLYLPNMEEAIVFKDIIQPILEKKCVTCHGSQKMKGNLRLDTKENIQKGGKNGNPLKDEALLLRRILLPPDDEEHMPPKEKGQLTIDEIQLIKWWINAGADFNVSVKNSKPNASISAILSKRNTRKDTIAEAETLPFVEAADPLVIKDLKTLGANISPIYSESNLLHVNLVNVKDSTLVFWEKLSKISNQLFTLKADLPFINNKHIEYLINAQQLRSLSLKGSSVDDNVFTTIQKFTSLQSLNLSDTKITRKGLPQLSANKNLRFLYMLDLSDTSFQFNLPNVEIIDRHFQVPILESDTTRVKESK